MLPGDKKPWAKRLATIVVFVSVIAAIVALYYLNDNQMLHIPEALIVALLLLTIIPPNIAIIRREPGQDVDPNILHHHPRERHP